MSCLASLFARWKTPVSRESSAASFGPKVEGEISLGSFPSECLWHFWHWYLMSAYWVIIARISGRSTCCK